jgi:hypothetical protein
MKTYLKDSRKIERIDRKALVIAKKLRSGEQELVFG